LCVFVARSLFVFFFLATASTDIYTLSLHDALPISRARAVRLPRARHPIAPPHPWGGRRARTPARPSSRCATRSAAGPAGRRAGRSEEHTSELQSRFDLVCRLLLEKKN